jgi:S1-C subfamily serine protease
MRPAILWAGVFALLGWSATVLAELSDTIDQVRPSIVVVGTYRITDSPTFTGRGTGFVVGNGNLVATNAHVLVQSADDKAPPRALQIQARLSTGEIVFRDVRIRAVDQAHDLAVLAFDGAPMPALKLGEAGTVREGHAVAFTGFPIGTVLGFSPVTHRAMISAITPIVLPTPAARQLNAQAIRRLRQGSFDIFQLDGTAYPGNSGSPLFHPETGEVLGIINMVFVKGSKETAITAPSGISYAIPATFLEVLLQGER